MDGKLIIRAKGADLPKSLKVTVQLSVAVVNPSRPRKHFSARPSHLLYVSQAVFTRLRFQHKTNNWSPFWPSIYMQMMKMHTQNRHF